MFEAFYKLTTNPFRLTPDPKFCFHHPSYDQAYAYLQYALQQGEGFVMVTGRPGIGKTTLVKTFLAELPDTDVITARIAAANVEATDLLCVVAHAYGVDYDHASKASLLLRLEEFFTRQARMGNRVLLIVDEAQGLPHSALEELRLLADLQLGSQPLLQLFLVGQEKLRKLMREPEMEQFQQRVIGACHLDPLDLSETRAYIEHRLHKADWKGDPEMSGGALLAIFQYSKGIPRHINKICTRLLLDGFMKESHAVSKEDATTVADELRSEQLAPLENAENAAIDCSYDGDDELTINDLTLRMDQQQVEQAEEARQAANEAEQGEPSCDQVMAQVSNAQVQPQWNGEIHNPSESQMLRGRQPQTGIRAFSDSLRSQPERGRAPVTPLKTSAKNRHTQRRPRSNGITQKGIHRNKKHAWQPKLLALFTALGSYASNAAHLLINRIKDTKKPAIWSLVAVTVLFAAILAANFSDSDDDQQTLALSQTGTPLSARPATQEEQPLAVHALPEEPVPEKHNSIESRSSDDQADNKPRERETVSAAPAIEPRKPAEQAPEPVKTAKSQPSAVSSVTSAEADTTAAADNNTVQISQEQIQDQDEAATVREPAAVVALVAQPQDEDIKVERTPAPVVKPAPVKKVSVAPSVSREEKITQLLAHGWRSLRRDRLLIPKNNNAYHYFQLVLKQDPGNSDALYGLDQIVSRYTALASTALDNNDKKKAERYIARGFRVHPDSKELGALRDRMNAPVVEVVSESPPVAAAAEPAPLEPVDYLTRFKAFLKTPPNERLLKPGSSGEQ